MNDVFDPTVARNFLLANIFLDENFDPDNAADMQYLWDVWYSALWTETTNLRFVKDLKKLIVRKWVSSFTTFPQPKGYDHMKRLFKHWIANACNMKPGDQKNQLRSR